MTLSRSLLSVAGLFCSGCSLLFDPSVSSGADAGGGADAAAELPCAPASVADDCADRGGEPTCHCGLCAYRDLDCDVSNLRYAGGGCVGVPVAIDSYYQHTCALRSDGTVWCWGWDAQGQIGDQPDLGGVEPHRSLPVPVTLSADGPLLKDALQVETGIFQTCALRAGGTVWCWGGSLSGQLGNGTHGADALSLIPVEVETSSGAGLDRIEEIVAGGQHVVARDEDGVLYAWGLNNYGQLGNGDVNAVDGMGSDQSRAVAGPGGIYRHAEAGGEHSCGTLADDDRVRCWGRDNHGQIGDGDDGQLQEPDPVKVQILEGGDLHSDLFALGNRHSCAVDPAPALRCWGWNKELAVGTDSAAQGTDVFSATRAEVSLTSGATDLEAGNDFGCVLLVDGTVACWGEGQQGQLGRGDQPDYALPAQVQDLADVRDLAVGWQHVCALTGDRRVYCWGANEQGQLGTGSEALETTPAAVEPMCP